ncbi:PAS domain-containing protein [Roseomonas populi]|uniref:histidine kinase n=1 Tax=Roseomonas populi TaxID=3121582 RepID=A0ABT1X8M8_9PROT|nr:PAS domain-containing protein [Roseomonas pecuniae]MCR0983329.1 PAS domain-containing protein [Roseomonas pecuniae]
MARRIRAFDWPGTPLGPTGAWPPSLRTAVDLLVPHGFAMIALWGPDLIQIYNDGYRDLMGAKHPRGLGQPTRECWPEVWHINAPIYARVRRGETLTFEDTLYPLERSGTPEGTPENVRLTITYSPLRIEDGEVAGILVTMIETTARHLAEEARARSEAALRESEARQAFLLKLSDALRPLSGPAGLQEAACRILAEQLDVDRAYYVEVDEAAGTARVAQDFVRGGAPSLAGEHRIADFAWAVANLYQDRHVVSDTRTSGLVPPADRPISAALGIIACMGAPLIKEGRLVGALCVTASHPRDWREDEVGLMREVAERIWAAVERARAEAALRESEERFRQFAASSSDALWVRDAATFAFEFASPALETIFGVAPDKALAEPRLLSALIVPEEREEVSRRVARIGAGERIVQEYRILRPTDRSFRWIRSTGFPLQDENGAVRRIATIASDITEARLLAEHQGVLLAELQHRVRNIMAVIRSVASRTAEGASDVEEYRTLISGRLLTLARVQALLTRSANMRAGITAVVGDELAAAGHKGQYALSGPEVTLSPKVAEVLTLAVHELATNAVKYGALSVPEGQVRVSWTSEERRGAPWLLFDWEEEGAPEPLAPASPRRRGFGTKLIEGRIPYELGGDGRITFHPGGARCRIEFPLRDGASILETGAPAPITVFGGMLDMRNAADLTGQHVLVVEDDYYIAIDTASALQGAGAEVLGPCPTEAAAREVLERATPTWAVLDINLGEGPSFSLARALRARGVPFLFITGYDEAAILPEFAGVARLQKPVEPRQLVAAIAEATGLRHPQGKA